MKSQSPAKHQHIRLGIDEIDIQHERLLQLMDELCDADEQNAEVDVVREITHDLFDYFDEHFSLEETLMDAAGYAHLEKHKIEHDSIIKKITEFYNCPEFNAMDLHWMLYHWLVRHIVNSDRDYAVCVQESLKRKHPFTED